MALSLGLSGLLMLRCIALLYGRGLTFLGGSIDSSPLRLVARNVRKSVFALLQVFGRVFRSTLRLWVPGFLLLIPLVRVPLFIAQADKIILNDFWQFFLLLA